MRQCTATYGKVGIYKGIYLGGSWYLDEAVGFVLCKHASAEGRCDT